MKPETFNQHAAWVSARAYAIWQAAYKEAREGGWGFYDAKRYANNERIRAIPNLWFLAERFNGTATSNPDDNE